MRQYRGLTRDMRWIYGWYLRTGGEHYIIPNTGYKAGNPRCPLSLLMDFTVVLSETVGQDTDFRDKNSVKIYEHDILDSGWVVRFYDGHYVLCNPTDEPAEQCAKEMLDKLVAKESIITGNIYNVAK